MIIIFDLDDTLYEERTYVESGFRAVATMGEKRFGWDSEVSFRLMVKILNQEGRGSIFDDWLRSHECYSQDLVEECVHVYRHHQPKLQLYPKASELLARLSGFSLYIVTDGNETVQQNKVDALSLTPLFKKIFITYRYGIEYAKPSTHCFQMIREKEKCSWQDMWYVGDNPAKDFVNLKPLGVNTVRVLTGIYGATSTQPEYDAHQTIDDLGGMLSIIKSVR